MSLEPDGELFDLFRTPVLRWRTINFIYNWSVITDIEGVGGGGGGDGSIAKYIYRHVPGGGRWRKSLLMVPDFLVYFCLSESKKHRVVQLKTFRPSDGT